MKHKGMDFKHKEVISIKDARRLGYVQDVCCDLKTGNITAIIVPGSPKNFSLFSNQNDMVISWDRVRCIGETVILVDI